MSPRAKPKPHTGRADFKRQLDATKASVVGTGPLAVALAKAASNCPNAGGAALLRAMAESGTDRGVRVIEDGRKK